MLVVTKVEKLKKDYNVTIGNKEYKLDEDTIVEFNLYKGKELDDNIIDDIIKSSNNNEYYNKALTYALRYQKNGKEVYNYLISKGLDNNNAKIIVNKLIDRKLINENSLIENIIYSLIKNHNGKNMIKEKLKIKGFNKELIDNAINNIDYDFYFENTLKIYEKIKHKYDKYDDYIRKNKIKQYLYSRGYDYNDINEINIE